MAGLRNAKVLANSSRQDSIAARNEASTEAVPFLSFLSAAKRSIEPRRTASGESSLTSSSQRSTYSVYLNRKARATDALSVLNGSIRQS